MNVIVAEAIAAEIATLQRLVTPPSPPLGYGTDLSCTNDITETLDEVDENSPLGIAQAAIRRLTTPRGGLADDPDYGLDVRGYANRATPATELRVLAGQIRNELGKDDRIADAKVTVSFAGNSELRIAILITPEDPALTDFSFTISVTDGNALLETITG